MKSEEVEKEMEEELEVKQMSSERENGGEGDRRVEMQLEDGVEEKEVKEEMRRAEDREAGCGGGECDGGRRQGGERKGDGIECRSQSQRE